VVLRSAAGALGVEAWVRERVSSRAFTQPAG